MNTRLLCSSISLLLALGFSSLAFANTNTITGLWWADRGGAQVEIVDEGGVLAGTVTWLRSPFDMHGCPLSDEKNPEEELRDRPIIGIKLLEGLKPTAGKPGSWGDGSIYDPGSGRTFRLTIQLESPYRLSLRGYVGFELLGQTRKWFRVQDGPPVCMKPEDGGE